MRDLRNDGISGSESLCKVGRIQSEANPIIFRRSLPLSHLMPSVRVSDESCTAHSDL
ncbi:Protein of unassigned function [Pseudomonas brassicacearum]